MIFSAVVAALFGALSLYMISAARGSVTRKMAWIPLSVGAMELAMAGALLWKEYPILTVVLMACRITVLSCCVVSLKKDAARERNRRRRREVWRYITAEMIKEAQASCVSRSSEHCA